MPSKNLAICIGNTDQKLDLNMWKTFVEEVRDILETEGVILSELFTLQDSQYQSAWFIFQIPDTNHQFAVEDFYNQFAEVSAYFNQDNIAIIELGEPAMVGPVFSYEEYTKSTLLGAGINAPTEI